MIPIYQGKRRQRGYGVGGNFASFYRTASPLLKNVGITVAKEALKAGSDMLEDFEKGKDWKENLKKHGKRAAKRSLNPLIDMGAKLATGKIKDIFSEDDIISSSTKRRKTSLPDDDDIFSD